MKPGSTELLVARYRKALGQIEVLEVGSEAGSHPSLVLAAWNQTDH